MLAAISSGLVHLHVQFYGKGPTRAKTHMVDDTIICMLEGGFTIVERTLIDDGKAHDVERIRRSFERTMERQFTGLIEAETGRAVVAYMSQVHADPDLAVELFVLEPVSERVEHEQELDLGDRSPNP